MVVYFFEKGFDPLLQERFRAAEEYARQNNKGLWQKRDKFFFLPICQRKFPWIVLALLKVFCIPSPKANTGFI